jgi:alpha-beta hydrolase superfamily lysophospholipase
VRKRHPGTPLYLLGESMGGALVMASDAAGAADGIVLVAPAVWSRDTMNPVQRLALWISAHTVPWLELTGEGLDIRPSDNLEMLRAFSGDPLVIKETRVDALWGITNLMDSAASAAGRLPARTLLLYGEKDEIIPRKAFCEMMTNLPGNPKPRIVLYARGWHMLTRDLQGERVMADIASWFLDHEAVLPSNEEASPDTARMARFCGGQAARNEHARS